MYPTILLSASWYTSLCSFVFTATSSTAVQCDLSNVIVLLFIASAIYNLTYWLQIQEEFKLRPVVVLVDNVC